MRPLPFVELQRQKNVPYCRDHLSRLVKAGQFPRTWASLPSKRIINCNGCHVVETGKRKYAPVLAWSERQTADKWPEAVIALVHRHPDTLDDERLL